MASALGRENAVACSLGSSLHPLSSAGESIVEADLSLTAGRVLHRVAPVGQGCCEHPCCAHVS